jgi:hypothetical protein
LRNKKKRIAPDKKLDLTHDNGKDPQRRANERRAESVCEEEAKKKPFQKA